ncbi:hypothetical protein ACHWQZ_G004799 [Mnemiopsis leidyi]
MLQVLLLIPLITGVSGKVNCEGHLVNDIVLQTETAQTQYDDNAELQKLIDLEPELDTRQTVLGFSLLTIKPPNYSQNFTNPCIQVDKADNGGDVTGHKVVLLAQSYPLGEAFCVNSGMDGFAEQCRVNEFKWCDDVVDEAQFQFSCDQQSCEKQTINLLVKMVVSDSNNGGEVEYWCDSTNDTYPSSLIQTKPNKQPEYTGQDPSTNKEAKEPSAALTNTIQLLVLFAAFLVPAVFA